MNQIGALCAEVTTTTSPAPIIPATPDLHIDLLPAGPPGDHFYDGQPYVWLCGRPFFRANRREQPGPSSRGPAFERVWELLGLGQ